MIGVDITIRTVVHFLILFLKFVYGLVNQEVSFR